MKGIYREVFLNLEKRKSKEAWASSGGAMISVNADTYSKCTGY